MLSVPKCLPTRPTLRLINSGPAVPLQLRCCPVPPLTRKRIVIASSNPETLSLIVPTLRGAGAAAFPAITTRAALALCGQLQETDLLIAHTAQPGSIELVQQVHTSNSNVGFLYVVGPTTFSAALRGSGPPAGLLIREPFSPNVLLRVVVRVLSRHRAA
jgi:DNA-binding response OmpR family regulator